MKILLVSDIVVPALYDRFDAARFSDIDMVMACGDLPPEYLSFIMSRLEVPLCYVRGNHDIRYASSPPQGCINLHAKIADIHGLRIMGLEGSRWYNGGPIQYREQEMRFMIWRMMPRLFFGRKIDIVMTHAPPRHVNDAEDRCHRGFNCFVKLINRIKPTYFVHGHIHKLFKSDHERMAKVGITTVINSFGYYILEIKNGKHS